MFTIARSPFSHNHNVFHPVVFYNISLKMPTLQSTLKALNSWPNVLNILFKTQIISNRAMHWNQKVFFLKGVLIHIHTYIKYIFLSKISHHWISLRKIATSANLLYFGLVFSRMGTFLHFSLQFDPSVPSKRLQNYSI